MMAPANCSCATLASSERALVVLVLVEMIHTLRVKGGGAALQAMDFVSFRKEQFGQIGAVLSSDSGNQGFFHDFHVNEV